MRAKSFSAKQSAVHCTLLFTLLLAMCIAVLMRQPVFADESAAQSDPTQYEVFIDDQSGILSDAEKENLAACMEPVTRFCNVAFLTTDDDTQTSNEYSRAFERTHWPEEPQISVLIDLGVREVVVNPSSSIFKIIDNDVCNLILDEIIGYAGSHDYYLCARNSFFYIDALLDGKTIADGTAAIADYERSLYTRFETSETGFEIIIEDFADLLTAAEKDALMEVMRPITAYGNVCFVSVDKTEKSTEDYAKDYIFDRYEDASSTLLLVDMKNRYIRIQSDGVIAKTVDEDYGDTITDNIYTYASDGDYYAGAEEAFTEILSLMEGKRIAQPMKYICNALLALIVSIVILFFVVDLLIRQKAPANEALAKHLAIACSISKMSVNEVVPIPRRSSDSSSTWFGNSGSSSGWSSGSSSSGSSSSGWSSKSSSSGSSRSSGSSSSGRSGSSTSRGGQHKF